MLNYHPMTLRRKMFIQFGSTIVGLSLIAIGAQIAFNGLREDFGVEIAGYQELRGFYEVGSHVSTALSLLNASNAEPSRIVHEVRLAHIKLDEFVGGRPPFSAALRRSAEGAQLETALRRALTDALAKTEAAEAGDAPTLAARAEEAAALNRVLARVTSIAVTIRQAISQKERDAETKRLAAIWASAALSLAVILATAIAGWLQYRGTMAPLRSLMEGVRRIASWRAGGRDMALTSAHFQPVPGGGADEFATLAAEFNLMASELDGFYHELEQKVAAKSKELVRSERLASVGYLAAGVAHEINNPLGIIAGYAERALEQSQQPSGNSTTSVNKALKVICEEAFRCKQITQKLLSLARPAAEARRPMLPAQTASQVVALLAGLSDFRQRQLTYSATPVAETMRIIANEDEIKQVILNLVLNALHATADDTGKINVTIGPAQGPAADRLTLTVQDNGRGMTPEVLDRIFEPFFTDKRGAQQAGTGLGLSITHAIVQSHGGRIRAYSDGPGKGSRFVVEFPIATETAPVDPAKEEVNRA